MKGELPIFLKQWRIKNEYSQGDIARLIGYDTPQHISNIERGLKRGPVSYCTRLSKFMNQKDYRTMCELLGEDCTT